jgi:DNA-binding protein YbaB
MKSFGDLVTQLAEMRFEASAGGGMVRAVVDGKQMVKELKLSPEALKDGDATLLEDLILTAVGEAQRTSQTHQQETMGKLTGGMNLPF